MTTSEIAAARAVIAEGKRSYADQCRWSENSGHLVAHDGVEEFTADALDGWPAALDEVERLRQALSEVVACCQYDCSPRSYCGVCCVALRARGDID